MLRASGFASLAIAGGTVDASPAAASCRLDATLAAGDGIERVAWLAYCVSGSAGARLEAMAPVWVEARFTIIVLTRIGLIGSAEPASTASDFGCSSLAATAGFGAGSAMTRAGSRASDDSSATLRVAIGDSDV